MYGMFKRTLYALSIMALATTAACGGCDDETGHGANHSDNQDQGANHSANHSAGTNSGTDPGYSDGPVFRNNWDPEVDGCPSSYQEVCGGTCINTRIDPDHCGGCGVVCGDGEVCSGGVCATSCLADDTICGRSCANLNTDNQHCGQCDNACPEGQGCNNGSCVPAAVFDAPAMCRGGGPPIEIEGTGTRIDRCSGEIAEERFRFALCSCSEVNLTSGGLYTDAFDSQEGPYVPGVLGGSVGVNRDFKCTADVDIGGSLWAGSGSSVDVRGRSTIHMDMRVDGALSSGGSLGVDVLENAAVRRSINPGGGGVRIADTLTVPEGVSIGGGITYGSLVRAPVNVAPPCACSPDEVIPVADIIAARRDNNDNALIGLDPNLLNGGTEYRRLDLPCGNYFLNGINVNSDLTIVAHGRTAIYIQGNVQAARLTLRPAPDAELDIFIDGRVQAGGVTIGSPLYPAATRLYLGSNERFQITKDVLIGGFVYAYPGRIHVTQDVEVFGGIFANELSVTAKLTIHYDRRILYAGDTCRDPDPRPDPDPNQDAGWPDANPGPDTGPGPDPGPDPVCVQIDGACSLDGDCCPPLVCDQGRCSATRCRGANEPCVYNSDCCSNLCAEVGASKFCIVN
jgi:hypothetical protein